VQKDIDEERVTPGQYFILRFDFSDVTRDSPELAAQSLRDSVVTSFEDFYDTYATYFGENSSKLYINYQDPANSLTKCVHSVNRVLRILRKAGTIFVVFEG